MKNNKEVIGVVVAYFNALIVGDAEAALGCCCKSASSDNDVRWLRMYLRMFNGLVDAYVIEVRYKTDQFAMVRVATDDGVEEREYSLTVLRESAPYVLADDGVWGVNPVSLRML